jgi:hypothetical protein
MVVLAVDERAIVDMTFQTPEVRVSAHRWVADLDEFELVVQGRNGRRFERCRSGAGFGQVLTTLSAIRVRRELGRDEKVRVRAAMLEAWALLEIADDVEAAPARLRLVFTPEDAVLVLDGDVSFEADLGREPFDKLAAGCAKLSPNDEAAPR